MLWNLQADKLDAWKSDRNGDPLDSYESDSQA
jgi:hypothetical protein